MVLSYLGSFVTLILPVVIETRYTIAVFIWLFSQHGIPETDTVRVQIIPK